VKPTRTVSLLIGVIGSSLLGLPAHAESFTRTDPLGCFQAEPSKAFVSEGSPSTPLGSRLWRFTSQQGCALLGESVATAGDVNGDGFDDVIVGSQWYDDGQYDEGEAFAFYGSPSGPDTNVDWRAHGSRPASNFAASVATAGDVNGDGYDDVIVGQAQFGGSGSAFAFLGSPTGLSLTSAWTAGAGQVGDEFGTSVASAGDVNGDGYDDVIVGAPGFDDGERGQGAAFVYLGSPFRPCHESGLDGQGRRAE
jgi:hypothetical protein